MEISPKKAKTHNFKSNEEASAYMKEMAALLGPLPSSVWAYILSNNLELTLRDVERMCSLNTKFQDICKDERVWENILEKELERSPLQWKTASNVLDDMYSAKEIVFMMRVFRHGLRKYFIWKFKTDSIQIMITIRQKPDGVPGKTMSVDVAYKTNDFVSGYDFLYQLNFYLGIIHGYMYNDAIDIIKYPNHPGMQTLSLLNLSVSERLVSIWTLFFHLAQDGFTLESEPDYGKLNAQCTVCSNNAVVKCALGCGTLYCGQACADQHYQEHFNLFHF